MIAGMAWTYFWFAGFIVEWYGNDPVVRELIHEEVAGKLAPFFYLQMTANLLPIGLLVFKKVRTTPVLLLATTLLVNVGMYTERVLGCWQARRDQNRWHRSQNKEQKSYCAIEVV